MTAICVPIFVKAGMDNSALEGMIEDAHDALEGTRGMLELRCDTATPRQVLEAIELAHLPVIVTVRPTWEGGHCEKDDEFRAGVFEAAIEAGAEYIDIELITWERHKNVRDRVCEAAEKSGARIILSNHSFEGRPKDLDARIARLRRVKQADILKIAWKAESILDGIEALALLEKLNREDRRPAVVSAMGEEGVISRVLAKKFNAAFTFAALEEQLQSAAGQPTAGTLRHTYRWDKQRPDSPVYGVAGWPIAHSKSPALHNAGFDSVGADGIYVPLLIKPAAFAGAIDKLRTVPTMNLRGLSVTIPHKLAAFQYVVDKSGKIDDLSWRIGVLNTLVWEGEGGTVLRGFNSDYDGAIDALVSGWTGKRTDLAGKRVAVIGAGGAGRAIVAGLVTHDATAVVYNRTGDKADALVADFADTGKALAGAWESLGQANCDAYINCTPLGMAPEVDASPVAMAPANWGPGVVVFDTVYNPPLTQFLRQAQEKGATIVMGTEMFIRQATAQFRAFTGKEPPVEEMRKVLAERPEPGAG